MAAQDRDDSGHFAEKMTEQDILKAFDYETAAEERYLTVSEVAEALAQHWDIDVTDEAVRARLEAMREDGMVAKRDFGSAVAYRALAAPALAEDVTAGLEDMPQPGDEDFATLSTHDDLRATYGHDE